MLLTNNTDATDACHDPMTNAQGGLDVDRRVPRGRRQTVDVTTADVPHTPTTVTTATSTTTDAATAVATTKTDSPSVYVRVLTTR